LAAALSLAAQDHYGHAGPAFVEAYLSSYDTSMTLLREILDAFGRAVPSEADGQVHRVARHFALIAAGGELATEFGIVPWSKNTATVALRACFDDWLKARGSLGAAETSFAVSLLREAIEKRAGLFEGDGHEPVVSGLGHVRTSDTGGVEYLISMETMKSLLGSAFSGRVMKELAARGVLKSDAEGRPNRKERIPGERHPQRVFVVLRQGLFQDQIEEVGNAD